MNLDTDKPTAEKIYDMRLFLARVFRTPLASVKVTGDPVTDENTDILKMYIPTDGDWTKPLEMEKLCPITAARIDAMLQRGNDLAEAVKMYNAFVSERAKLYQ